MTGVVFFSKEGHGKRIHCDQADSPLTHLSLYPATGFDLEVTNTLLYGLFIGARPHVPGQLVGQWFGRSERGVCALEKGSGVACHLFCLCLKTRNNLNLACQ